MPSDPWHACYKSHPLLLREIPPCKVIQIAYFTTDSRVPWQPRVLCDQDRNLSCGVDILGYQYVYAGIQGNMYHVTKEGTTARTVRVLMFLMTLHVIILSGSALYPADAFPLLIHIFGRVDEKGASLLLVKSDLCPPSSPPPPPPPPPHTTDHQRQLLELRASHADTISELEKTRRLLTLQQSINKDCKKEVRKCTYL